MLTHERVLARQEDKSITRAVKVPPGLTSGVQFLRYGETVLFGKVVNHTWTASGNANAVLADPSKHIGETVNFTFKASVLAKIAEGAPATDEKGTLGKAYSGLDPTTKSAIDEEIDRRYYESTSEAPGTKIKSGETGKIAIWNNLRAQVMEDRRKLDALPDAVKSFLGGSATFTPDKYQILNRLGAKLAGLSVADLEDYKSKTTSTTTDLARLEASIDAYLAAKRAREEARTKREDLVTKIFGAEDLYREYKNIGRASADLYEKARLQDVQGAGHVAAELRKQAKEVREQEVATFTKHLKDFGFTGGIPEWLKSLDDYEKAFLDETVAIVLDVLQKYEHKLFEAEAHYASDANVDALLAQVQASGAPELLAQASARIKEAHELSEKGRFQTVQGAGDIGNKLSNEAGRKMNEAAALTAQASKRVRELPGNPMIGDEKFPRQALLANDRAKAKAAIAEFIAARRADVKKARDDLAEDPKVVYKLPKIMAMSRDAQGIASGSVFDQLITDRQSAYVGIERLWMAVAAIVAIALGVVTAGGGTIAVVAAIGAFGLSSYQAIQEYREYERQSAFAGVGLADDPNMAWVIIAVVGAAADLGSAVAALHALKASKALATLEKTKDIAQFERDLAAIKEMTEAQRAAVVRAGKAQVDAHEWLRSMFASTGRLNAVVIPGLEQAGHLAIAAYFAIKRGVATFQAWLIDLKAAGLIGDASTLSNAERNALKAAWAEGRAYTEQIKKNIPELETAIREFRAETGIQRGLTAEGRVAGGTSAAAKTEIEGLSKSTFREGSTRSKGARAADVRTNPRYQSPQKFGATKNHAEQNVLGDVADEIDKARGFSAELKGTPKPDVTGRMHLHVEQEVCAPCRQGLNNPDVLPGVVKQFSHEYPNVTLVITNARTNEVLFVRGGKVVLL